ncbi:putative triacylglycerol lipase [Helianthus annuus]|nr:putative triacylglycerol lipase [Helianthus annuus]
MLPLVVNVVFICLYASVCLRCSVAAVNKPKNNSLPAVIAFGDSFADSGNNNFRVTLAKANFYPYGKDFMGGKPTGRFTNGKTLADTIAAKLGVMDYLPAYLDPSLQNEDMIRGVSFASASSGFDPLTGRLLVCMHFLFSNIFLLLRNNLHTLYANMSANLNILAW